VREVMWVKNGTGNASDKFCGVIRCKLLIFMVLFFFFG